MGRKRKAKYSVSDATVELNVMPFIDIFSLLCTFLLFSAVFASVGVLNVQVPFFSDAPSVNTPSKPERELEISVLVQDSKIELTTKYTQEPKNPTTRTFAQTSEGIEKFHAALMTIKSSNSALEKVLLFTDDNLIYDDIVDVLDAIKFVNFGQSNAKSGTNPGEDFLFEKVVLGSVLL